MSSCCTNSTSFHFFELITEVIVYCAYLAMEDIRIDLIIPRLNATDNIAQVSGIVASVGPIMDTTNGKHVREVVVVDPVSFTKVKLLCYNDGSMQDFTPHMGVFISDARYRDEAIIVTSNTSVFQLTSCELPASTILQCDAILRPPATTIISCTAGSVDITISGVLTQVIIISLFFTCTISQVIASELKLISNCTSQLFHSLAYIYAG